MGFSIRRFGKAIRPFAGSKDRPLSTTMAIPIIVFSLFWAFAAYVVSAQGWAVLAANTLNSDTSQPGLTVVNALQQERRATVVYLAAPDEDARQAMLDQRRRTDTAVKRFRELASSDSVRRVDTDAMQNRIIQAIHRLDGLGHSRAGIDSGNVSGEQATGAFNSAIDPVFAVFNATSSALNDSAITQDSRTLNSLTRAKEILSREDAFLAGAIAANRLTPADQAQFAELAGAWNYQHTEAVAALPAADRARDANLVRSPAFTRLATLERRVIEYRRTGHRPVPASLPVDAAQWQRTTQPAMAGLQHLVDSGGTALLARSTPVAIARIVEFALVAVLGVAVLFALVVLAIRTVRDLSRRLRQLQTTAEDLATRLPNVVERISNGEQVDMAQDAPPLDVGTDEIGRVGAALNTAYRTAIDAAASQAEARRSIRDVLTTVARRMQAGLHRQLRVLDRIERRGDLEQPVLEEIFEVDQEATRARRYTESVVIWAGGTPARGWSHPQPLFDVARAAIAEVGGYERVSAAPMDGIMLAGRAVGELSHLLAELIDNAVSFSDPRTAVHVRGQYTSHGYAVEIEDRGLGMNDDRLAEVNQRIHRPGEFNVAASDSDREQLGLHVVARIAARFGIGVELTRNAYAGITAIVLLPKDLLPEETSADSQPDPAPSTMAAVTAVNAATVAPVPRAARISDAQPHEVAPGALVEPRQPPASPPATPVATLRLATDAVDGVTNGPADGAITQPAAPQGSEPAPTASGRTANGLPIRNRRKAPPPQQPVSSPPAPARSSDDVRMFVGALTAGTQRARAATDAARAASEGEHPDGAQARDAEAATQHGSEEK